MKNQNRPSGLITRDLPGLCIILQSLAAIFLTGFLAWLFITSELL